MEFDDSVLNVCHIGKDVYKFTSVEQQREIIIALGDNQMSVKPDISMGIVIARMVEDQSDCWFEVQVISIDKIINYNVG